mgnify:CR=1 FL=1
MKPVLRPIHGSRLFLRRRQPVLVHLSPGGERDFLQTDHTGGNHVFRQPGSGKRQQLHLRDFLRRTVIGGQDQLAVQFQHLRRRFPHSRVRGNAVRRLLRLDAQPAQLHLAVQPSGQHNFPFRRPAGDIPGGIHPLPCFKWILQEAFFRKLRCVPVASSHTDAADKQLSVNACRQRVHPPIQHIHATAGKRPADSN